MGLMNGVAHDMEVESKRRKLVRDLDLLCSKESVTLADVAAAALTILVAAMRQHPKRSEAQLALDYYIERTRQSLDEQYTATGVRIVGATRS